MPPREVISGESNWEETTGQTQNILEGLYITSVDLGNTQNTLSDVCRLKITLQHFTYNTAHRSVRSKHQNCSSVRNELEDRITHMPAETLSTSCVHAEEHREVAFGVVLEA